MSSEEEVDYPSQHVVACEDCGITVSVNWYCKNCPGSLCDSCKVSHKTKGITKRHSVVPRTGAVVRTYGPAKIAEECKIHTGKEISTYCNDCKAACCVSCHIEKHQRHEMSHIEDKYLGAEKRLNDYTKELETNVKSKLKEMKTQVQTEAAKANQSSRDVEAEVNTFRKELKQAVDESCDAIIQILKRPNNEFDSLTRDINSRIQNIEQLIDKIGVRIREGKLSLIEYSPPTPDSLIPNFTSPSLSLSRFVPNREVLDMIKTQLGTLDSTKSEGSDNALGKTSVLPTLDKSTIKIEKVKSFRCEIGATSVITIGENVAWVADFRQDSMYLYSNEGKKVRSKTVKKGKGINDLAIKLSGEIIVSNTDKKVRSVAGDGEVSTIIDTTPYVPYGVCVTEKDELVVCMQHENDFYVAVYSSDGLKKLRDVRVKDAQGKQFFTDPFRVIQNCEDLCVVNSGKNVICVGEQDNLRWVYDGTQANLERSFGPYGICRDKYHNLLVTDLNSNCVHYIDREGQLIQVILTREQIGLIYHWGISVDKTGHVWVVNSAGNVVVATYLK